MIILKDNQISIVQDEICRYCAGFKHKISITYIRNVIFRMMELKEDNSIAKLKTITYVIIIYDGWSRWGAHYL